MTAGASSEVSSLLDELEQIARTLDSTALLHNVDGVRARLRRPKLSILVLGAAGSGRSTLINHLLSRPDTLPESPIPKPPIPIDLQHGETPSAVRQEAMGRQSIIPIASLHAFLLDPASDATQRVEMHVPAELLEGCELTLDSIGADRSPAGWHEVLERHDYIILTLNATALLSQRERRFLREQLAGDAGLERVAIVITHIDLVPEDERDSILETLTVFLGPFASQPAILTVSLARSADATGQIQLCTLIGDVIERQEPLRQAALDGALIELVDAAETATRGARTVWSVRDDEIEEARNALASQRARLGERIERMQWRVDAFVDTLLQQRILRRIESFGNLLRERLPGELESIEDVGLIRRHLPGYLETVWTDFLRTETIGLSAELSAEESRIRAMIESDIRELVQSIGPATRPMEREVARNIIPHHVFVMPRRGKHLATSFARGLELHGWVMLFFAPPIGVASLAASQVLQHVYKDDIARADRSATLASAVPAATELEHEIKSQIGREFAGLRLQLHNDIAAMYQQAIDEIGEILAERTRHRENAAARRAELSGILTQQLPYMRARFQQRDAVAP